ncbi:calcium-independent phospholipase A2-gamma-like isoform X2 [Xyrauchen texanus]|uniref:calcium-independent phospholipase A2-gamma-like isoform X2 n=1 Tax=Xyrauchen texanus TaxID=154827 RepID=UPI002242A6E0|nr:calcium-independent phospholipase A2-gamma-like isoform X2 [Xyrauchen texanus]
MMGWYIDKNWVTHLGSRRLRLLCKMKYLLSNFRNVSQLVRSPFSMRPHRSCQSLFSSSVQSSRTRLKSNRSKMRIFSITPTRRFRTVTNNMKFEYELSLQIHRFYSSSSRESFKAEAPIGVYQNSRTPFRLHFLGMRLGESFNRLSRHINMYFMKKEASLIYYEQEGLMCAVQDPLTRTQRRAQSQRALRERHSGENSAFIGTPALEQIQEASSNQSQGPSLSNLGLQLFHISSLATRFGESYSYVANHINSVFTRSPAKHFHAEVLLDDEFRRSRGRKRRVVGNKSDTYRESELQNRENNTPTRTLAAEISNNKVSSSWEEGYVHFARHINRYFGAKADSIEELPHNQRTASADHQMSHTETQMLKSSIALDQSPLEGADSSTLPLRPKGLFHMSSLTTHFGENYTYMANHINRYFKGSAVSEVEGEMDREHYTEQNRDSPEYTMTQKKTVSFFQSLLKPSTIPSLVGSFLGIGSSRNSDHTTYVARAPEAMLYKTALGRRKAEDTTRVLLNSLQEAMGPSAITSCVEELNAHLIQHPACKAVVWQEKSALQLLRRRRIFWMNEKLQEAIRETLALIGYIDPVKGCGIRVLSIDGGGTKGIVPLQVLKQLEAQTGKRVYQLFDYICGVSTGAVLAFLLGLAHISLDECEEMYHRFGSDVFRQNPLVGTVKMGWTHSYYNTETWEMILREKMEEQILIKTARDEQSPKVSAVSAVVNWGTSPKAFIFRNYNHSPGRLSRYAGGSGYQLWEAVRASSAAPGYFQEFPLQGDIHQDGGLILNNPCALAVNESRLLWPNQPFQCVLSLGTGRYDNARRGPATSTSLRAKISNLICSATDTEGVHTLLDDLLSPNVYFRFNPMLSLNVTLDESRPGVLQQLQKDTQLYMDRNQPKLDRMCDVLMAERTAIWKTRDWIGEKAWELQQRWA